MTYVAVLLAIWLATIFIGGQVLTELIKRMIKLIKDLANNWKTTD